MKISVVIPTYNSAATIEATLNSVLRQTELPHEILVMDDGSKDKTLSLLAAYSPRVTVFQQENRGVADARNALCARASGDLVAFLDHDDLWHPRYLEQQRKLFERYPKAVAFFTGHVNFRGYEDYQWNGDSGNLDADVEVLDSVSFFRRYNEATGPFASMSYCCIPKEVLTRIGAEPFRVSGVDDSYLCNILALLGPVVYAPARLVAYRMTSQAQSENRLKALLLWVTVFQLLEERFRVVDDVRLRSAFAMASAAKSRQCARILMGVGRVVEARRHLVSALANRAGMASLMKSAGLLLCTYMPAALQPQWPPPYRE